MAEQQGIPEQLSDGAENAPVQRAGLCRDCLHMGVYPVVPTFLCPDCRSPRWLNHPELHELSLAHIDCDSFYAAVEKRDNPELADKPVIIGGGKRGVVATACYVARMYGVRSAMPMFKALKACPDAVVIKPDMRKYQDAGRQIRELLKQLTPLVQPLSIDEAFLDLSGAEARHGASAAMLLSDLALRISADIGVTISIGLSFNKFLAKLASDLDKPRGFSVIGQGEVLDFLAPRPVGDIFGVGKSLGSKLTADGIRTIGDLRRFDEMELMRRYGAIGKRLHHFSYGRDKRKVNPNTPTKSISTETTFRDDIADPAELTDILRRLSDRVADSLKRKGFAGRTITLKLRTPDFAIRTRSHTLGDLTQRADVIFFQAEQLLLKEANGRQAFRLIGVGVAGLGSPETADLPDLFAPLEIPDDQADST